MFQVYAFQSELALGWGIRIPYSRDSGLLSPEFGIFLSFEIFSPGILEFFGIFYLPQDRDNLFFVG